MGRQRSIFKLYSKAWRNAHADEFCRCLKSRRGLQELLQSTVASVPKTLNEKKFPENVRVLRIFAEEILRPILENHSHAGDWH